MIIGLLVAASAVWGQSSLSFYAEAGIGTSRLYGRHSGSDTQTAYKAGVGAEYTLNRTWALQSALEFISIGGKDDMQYVEHAKMHELYLQIPVMVAARLPLGENYHASLGLGPYIACGVGGKTSGEMEEYDYSSEYNPNRSYRFRIDTFGNRIDDKMGNKRFDAGLMFGLNIEYHKFIFGAELQLGMIRVNDQLDNLLQSSGIEKFSPKNLASFFTIGYRF